MSASGGATGERSRYGPLAGLLNAVGATLKPKVFCVQEPADQGAGHPDFGLYTGRQVQKGRRREGQLPEHGVVEVKSPAEDALVTADGEQVERYRLRYGTVLVTNTRDFVLAGEDGAGQRTKLERFELAANAEDFEKRLQKPRTFAQEVGAGLGEYVVRHLLDLGAIPHKAAADAAHIAIAAANGVEFLATWNFRHIANAAMRVPIESACRQVGYKPPVICTPNELMEASHGDETD